MKKNNEFKPARRYSPIRASTIANNRGTTLLEVLLYIALFAVMSSSLVSFYISFSKMAEGVKMNIQRVEISLFMHEIVRYRIDSANAPDLSHVPVVLPAQSFQRIFKFYPNMSVSDVEVMRISSSSVRVTYDITSPHKKISSIFFMKSL